MAKTFLLPLQLTSEGAFATTIDPRVCLEQQILDLLCTNWGERVMRPRHGANMERFLFSPMTDAFLSPKAAEIKNDLNNTISYGEIQEVTMSADDYGFGSIRVVVYYRLYLGGDLEQVAFTFTGLLDEETILQ